MAASLTIVEMVALLKTRRDEPAAAAQKAETQAAAEAEAATAAARFFLGVFGRSRGCAGGLQSGGAIALPVIQFRSDDAHYRSRL